ncbi:MAG: cation:proton antiporter domain-containing protein [Alphaproteobacteria bacterium]
MEQSYGLTGIAIVALAALVCGIALTRLRLPALVGYILAGMLLGPSAFGLVEDRDSIGELAELGVLMLLFLIGMELPVRVFRAVWRLALTAVAVQVVASVAVILLLAGPLGFSLELSVLLGFVVALSSTAVAIRTLEDIGETRSRVGRITIAVLIAQDLAFVPMLITVENFSGSGFSAAFQIAVAIMLLALLIRYLGRVRRLRLPFTQLIIGNADLSPLTGLVYCFGGAALAGLIGLSAAYGAFLAGLLIGNSAQRQDVLRAARPIQSILLMVFFLSIGLLIDLAYIYENLATVLLLLVVVTLFKTALNIGIFRAFGERWRRAFLEGVTISQVGEFSFLLAASGLAAGAIDPADNRLVVAVTVLSLALSPFWVITARRAHGIAERQAVTLGEILRAVYGGEAAMLRRGTRAVTGTVRGIHKKHPPPNESDENAPPRDPTIEAIARQVKQAAESDDPPAIDDEPPRDARSGS